MSTPNFSSILDEAPTEVIRPKPIPAGTYTFVVGQPEYGKSTKKDTPFVKFPLRPITAGEDVDEEELQEAGGFDGKVIGLTFWLTPDAVFMLDQFHEHCGLDLTDQGSRRARNEEVVNAQVLGVVKHRTSDDGERIYAEIARTGMAD